jgi:hypothetical protein
MAQIIRTSHRKEVQMFDQLPQIPFGQQERRANPTRDRGRFLEILTVVDSQIQVIVIENKEPPKEVKVLDWASPLAFKFQSPCVRRFHASLWRPCGDNTHYSPHFCGQ